jgi:hypothetical protein
VSGKRERVAYVLVPGDTRTCFWSLKKIMYCPRRMTKYRTHDRCEASSSALAISFFFTSVPA